MHYDVIIIGAGAAGLMCASTAARRGRTVLLLEHTAHIGEKIRISGGGRCNFTNSGTTPHQYLSDNPHFCTSALSRYTPKDFIALIEKHKISYHEKTLGQLFCDGSSKQIITMLLTECEEQHVSLTRNCHVENITKPSHFHLNTSTGDMSCDALVIATGGLSIPKLGATGFGYEVAKQFGIEVTTTRPALVPLVIKDEFFQRLSGISTECIASSNGQSFREQLLFTHRGLSGPAILQVSSYLELGEILTLNLLPYNDIYTSLKEQQQGKNQLAPFLARYLPKRLAQEWVKVMYPQLEGRTLAEVKAKDLQEVAARLQQWHITPEGTEGYAKAEVTAGGVDTNALSSKTMEAKKVPGLYFIGEVVDVTGWLGGYNFQWAWASAVAAGLHA